MKIDGMAGYTGKDLSCLELFFNIYKVPEESKRLVLEIISFLINKSVETEAEKLKAAQKSKEK